MLREVSTIILRKLPRSDRYIKPGAFCNSPRFTQFRGEIKSLKICKKLSCLDRFNSKFTKCKSKIEDIVRRLDIFKSVACLVFLLLDLYLFSDGNGRLCRL